MDNLKNLPKWQQYAFGVAAIALIAGISFVVSQSGSGSIVAPPPQDVVSKVQSPDEALPQNGTGKRQGGVLVLPTEIYATSVSEGVQLPPITVQNRSDKKARILVDFVPVNDFFVSGAPQLDTSAKNIAEGKKYVELDKSRFTLSPGQSQQVRATVVGKPAGGLLVGSIGSTVIDPKTLRQGPDKSGVVVGIRNNVRINSMLYLSWPEASNDQVTLERVRAQGIGKGSLAFQVRVRGSGNSVATPNGQVIVRNQAGQQIAGGRITGQQRVVPGSERDLLLDAPVSNLQPGNYEAEAVVESGGKAQSVSWAFRIDENGQLPTPRARVALRLSAARTKPAKTVDVRLEVENTGTRNFAPRGTMKLYELGSEEALDQRSFSLDAVSPGNTAGTSESFVAPAKPGNYEIMTEVQAEDSSLLDQRVVSFSVEAAPPPPPSATDRFRDWLSENPFGAVGVGIIVFALLVAIVTIAVAIIQRAKKK